MNEAKLMDRAVYLKEAFPKGESRPLLRGFTRCAEEGFVEGIYEELEGAGHQHSASDHDDALLHNVAEL